MRPVYLADEVRSSRFDSFLVQGALTLAAAVALALGVLAMNDARLVLGLAAAALLAFAAWAYRTNEVRRDLRVPLGDVWDVAVEALGENGFLFGAPHWDGATEGHVRAGDALVVAERHPGGVTRVRVSVGLFRSAENRRRASLILESLTAHVRRRAPSETE